MGEAFLYGNGSETELAVKVVGGTQKPSNAKQGTIWVNTDQKITVWTIQVEEPAEPIEGMVWIYNLTSTRFNALKKNGIWFTPTQAKQYVSGAWVKKTGEYYNNNQWVVLFEATINVTYPEGSVCTATDGVTTLTSDNSGSWAFVVPNAGTWTVSLDNGFSEDVVVTGNGQIATIDKWYLYKSGNEYTDRTGGWVKRGEAKGDLTIGQVTFGDSAITLSTKSANSGTSRYNVVFCATAQLIDVTNYDKLYAFVSEATTVGHMAIYADNTSWNSSYTAVAKRTIGKGETGIIDLDITGITGLYYVGFLSYSELGGSGKITVTKAVIE